jgi:hypothetical protein
VTFKIDAIITDAKPVQDTPASFQFAEFVQFGPAHLLWQAPKVAQHLQLQVLGHPRQFGGAYRRKNDLECVHWWLRVEG